MTWLAPSQVPGGTARRFFISYAVEDLSWAQELTRLLRAAGHEVFWDKLSLRAGEQWPDELRAALGEADVLWLGWSKHASRSEWVEREYSAALARGPGGIRIDALDGAALPAALADMQVERSVFSRGMADRLLREPVRALSPSDVKPSSLLKSEHAVVPFIGRDTELGSLDAWCEAADPFAVRLYIGAGGSGKTRFAVEACLRQQNRGWDAGFLESRGLAEALSASPEALDELLAPRRAPRLLLLDYAETQRTHVDALLWRAARKVGGHNVRLILLARTAGDWWTDILQRDDRFSQVVGYGTDPITLEPLARDLAERAGVFEEAVAAFAARLQTAQPPRRPVDALDGDVFEQVLFLHIAAYAAVLGESMANRLDLLDFALEREAQYWRKEASDLRLRPDFTEMLPLAASIAVLAGGYDSEQALAEALACHTDLAEYPRLDRTSIAKVLAVLYGDGGRIAPLAPDLLAEHVVWRYASTDRKWLLAWFKGATDGQIKQGLVVLSRMHSTYAEVRDWLGEVLIVDLERFAQPAIDVAVQTGDPIGVVLGECFATKPNPVLAREIEAVVPFPTVSLRELAVVISRQALEAANDEEEAAGTLNNLGNRFSDLGRREDALAAVQEAVAIRRRLAESRPDAFLPDLATSLNNLGSRLSDLGRREDALAAAQEATAIRLSLVEFRPDAFLPDLATSLNDLGNRLSDLGRREDALTATQTAAGFCRRLAQLHPDAFLPDLAMSLNQLGISLGNLGRREDALAAAQEGVAIRRRLADSRPDAFLPDLATSLNNLGSRLSDLGRHEDALAATQEATDHYRRLADSRPDAFVPDLATSLNNLGNRFSNLDRYEEALAATQEATAIRLRLVESRPDAFLPDFAMSLNDLCKCFSKLSRREDAFNTAQKAEGLCRRLAESRPDAFLPDLATSLNNLGISLRDLGRREDALAAAQEATDHYRRLAESRPDAFLPHLAISLNSLGLCFIDLGRREDALTATQEAVVALRAPFVRIPPAFASQMQQLLRSYLFLANDLGREPDAALSDPIIEALNRLADQAEDA